MATKGSESLQESIRRYAFTTRLIAIRSMRKSPKRPRSRFGNQQPYTKRSKKFGQTFWRKGEYSRPGEPPFWHEHTNPTHTLRDIRAIQRGPFLWAVGSTVFARSRYNVPALHEYGGSVTVTRTNYAYNTKYGGSIRRKQSGTAVYPKRPYIKPALIKAKYHRSGKKNFIDRQNSIGKMIPTKRAT